MKKFASNLKKRLVTIALTAAVAISALLPATASTVSAHSCSDYEVTGTTHYLALRSEPYSADYNIIGELYNGDSVELIDTHTGSNGFWYVYAPTLGKYGYTKKAYLTECGYHSYSHDSYYTVSGTKHYLALRTSPYTSERNEIGELYNGDSVQVLDKNTGHKGFWYVYAPSLGDYGYVKSAYLY